MFAEFGDEISLYPANALSVSFQGEFSEGLDCQNNSIIDAVNWFENYANVNVQQKITVEKNIPVMAGLGGGTADAAAIIHALCQIYHIEKPEPSALAILGADVPVSFFGSSARMRGIGENLCFWAHEGYEILLINPREAVKTKSVFSSPKLSFSGAIDSDIWAKTTNDMEATAIEICPKISTIIDGMKSLGAEKVRMTGSGSTVFAIGQNMQKFYDSMSQEYPEFWTKHSFIKPSVQPPDHTVRSTFS